jgi:hypothetical protein
MCPLLIPEIPSKTGVVLNNYRFTFTDATSALPLSLLLFTARLNRREASLEWKITNEKNTDYFEVQRAEDGINYSLIGKVPANKTTDLIAHYSLIDDLASVSSTKIYYRLKEVKTAGSIQYSNTISFSLGLKNFSDIHVGPNPFRNTIQLSVETSSEDIIEIGIFQLDGKKIYSRQFTVLAGATTISLGLLEKLNPGIYTLRVSGKLFSKSQCIIKQ